MHGKPKNKVKLSKVGPKQLGRMPLGKFSGLEDPELTALPTSRSSFAVPKKGKPRALPRTPSALPSFLSRIKRPGRDL